MAEPVRSFVIWPAVPLEIRRLEMRRKFPEIFVLRHGQTEWNRDGPFQDSGNSPLTDLGRRQAQSQDEILQRAGVARRKLAVFSSSQGRTRQTADIVGSQLGCSHQADGRLVELSLGAWEGM